MLLSSRRHATIQSFMAVFWQSNTYLRQIRRRGYTHTCNECLASSDVCQYLSPPPHEYFHTFLDCLRVSTYYYFLTWENPQSNTMKLAVAALCIVPAIAFAPRSASFGTRHSTLNAVATSDVRIAFALIWFEMQLQLLLLLLLLPPFFDYFLY